MTTSDATVDPTRPLSSEGRAPRPQIPALMPAAPGAAARARRYVPVPLDTLADTGQPVDDPPPVIEPVGFDEPASPPADTPRRSLPPRRSFLAPLRVTRPRPPAPVPPEAVAEPRPERARLQVSGWLRALARQWRRGAAAAPKLGDRRRLVSWGRWAAAAGIGVAIIYFAGHGLFPRPAHKSVAPLAGAPSDPAQRLAYFQRGAQAGDPEAELQLAILYAKGEGVAQDYAIAATWFRAAAEQGLPRAQYDLGVLYDRGRGVPADPVQAVSWYLKAAEGKYPLAQYNLAVAYTKGEGTRQDSTEAALWYRRAAGQGVVQAMVNLGMLYERGEGVSVSPVDAYAWYLAAGRRGNQPAARRAEDLFAAFSQLDQVRAQALASDVAGSIHDPAQDTGAGG
jgi:TPR repeat protein